MCRIIIVPGYKRSFSPLSRALLKIPISFKPYTKKATTTTFPQNLLPKNAASVLSPLNSQYWDDCLTATKCIIRSRKMKQSVYVHPLRS